MATYSILVTTPPYDDQGPLQALEFCRALVKAGHTIDNVFFYQSGIYNANRFIHPANDEKNLYQQWCELQQNCGVTLLVCITAATKRGITSEQESQANDIDGFNLTAPFEQAGLGEFFTRLHDCEKLVQF